MSRACTDHANPPFDTEKCRKWVKKLEFDTEVHVMVAFQPGGADDMRFRGAAYYRADGGRHLGGSELFHATRICTDHATLGARVEYDDYRRATEPVDNRPPDTCWSLHTACHCPHCFWYVEGAFNRPKPTNGRRLAPRAL